MKLSNEEQQLVNHIANCADGLFDQLAAYVAIPTGRDYQPGLDDFRQRLINRLETIGGSATLHDGRPRPSWMQSRSKGGQPLAQPQPIVEVASPSNDDSLRRILIAGHIDTVHDPDGDFQTLTKCDDGKTATGPGAVDMKGGILCALAALEALHAHDVDCNWTFLLNGDEETGSFQSEHILRDAAKRHDIGIALEPALADGSLAIERMGSGQFMIEVHGTSAHVGREFEKGRSAVTKLGELLVAIGDMADPSKGMILNVGPIEGGQATNVVPDYAACWGNVRFADATVGERLGEMIDALASDDDDGSESPRVVVHRHWNRPAKPKSDAVEALALRARTVAEDLGQSLPFASTGGVCDGNILQDAGLPTLDTLGIRGGNLHRLDEFIENDAIVERAQLLAVYLSRIRE